MSKSLAVSSRPDTEKASGITYVITEFDPDTDDEKELATDPTVETLYTLWDQGNYENIFFDMTNGR